MTVSACLITRNEAANIGRCLESVRLFADEIIIVDTGSTDNTPEICKQYGARVFHHKWESDFSKARNQSIEKARGNWIIFVDADDVVPIESAEIINTLKTRPPNRYFIFTVRNIAPCTIDTHVKIMPEFIQPRMFPNHKGIVFQGRVHEGFAKSAIEKGLVPNLIAGTIIEHHGYSDLAQTSEKIKRNIRLILFSMGFPEKKDFIEFQFGVSFYCFYQPNCLTVWHGRKLIGAIDPFAHTLPRNDNDRADQMKDVARACIDEYFKTGTLFVNAQTGAMNVR